MSRETHEMPCSRPGAPNLLRRATGAEICHSARKSHGLVCHPNHTPHSSRQALNFEPYASSFFPFLRLIMPSLPDVLHLIPPYIRDIEDYLALSVTGREVRSLVQEYSSPSTLLVLCYHSRRTFFRPDPLFLLTPLAPPLSIWARRSTENLRRLVHAFYYGEEAVLDLGISVPAVAIEAEWSMARVCQLWEWRMRVVTPLTDLIDRCVGQQWYAQADFWDGGVEDAATLYAEPAEVVFRMLIYGELFKDGWHEWIEGTDRVSCSSAWYVQIRANPTRVSPCPLLPPFPPAWNTSNTSFPIGDPIRPPTTVPLESVEEWISPVTVHITLARSSLCLSVSLIPSPATSVRSTHFELYRMARPPIGMPCGNTSIRRFFGISSVRAHSGDRSLLPSATCAAGILTHLSTS